MIMWIVPLLSGVAVGGLVSLVVPYRRQMSARVRPYTIAASTSLGVPPDASLENLGGPSSGNRGVTSIISKLAALLDAGDGAAMAEKLEQSGLPRPVDGDPLAEYRMKQFLSTAGAVGLAVVAGLAFGLGTTGTIAVIALAFIVGVTRWRGRIERAIEQRRLRMRIEIYTVNQLLAMRVRVGGGVMRAIGHVVERGSGEVVGDLAEVLRIHATGTPASEALAAVAARCPEPHAARTYRLLAEAEERGADLAGALLALSEDVREARREAMRRTATKRRAAMLIPTIAILAPVMLLFVAAPLPSIVFGGL